MRKFRNRALALALGASVLAASAVGVSAASADEADGSDTSVSVMEYRASSTDQIERAPFLSPTDGEVVLGK